jgi:hypothetical protein
MAAVAAPTVADATQARDAAQRAYDEALAARDQVPPDPTHPCLGLPRAPQVDFSGGGLLARPETAARGSFVAVLAQPKRPIQPVSTSHFEAPHDGLTAEFCGFGNRVGPGGGKPADQRAAGDPHQALPRVLAVASFSSSELELPASSLSSAM